MALVPRVHHTSPSMGGIQRAQRCTSVKGSWGFSVRLVATYTAVVICRKVTQKRDSVNKKTLTSRVDGSVVHLKVLDPARIVTEVGGEVGVACEIGDAILTNQRMIRGDRG